MGMSVEVTLTITAINLFVYFNTMSWLVPFFKNASSIYFIKIFFKFFRSFLAVSHGMQDVSSLTRDWIRAPCSVSAES